MFRVCGPTDPRKAPESGRRRARNHVPGTEENAYERHTIVPTVRIRNTDVADALERVADLLEAQGANAWRVRAYRAAADTARTWPVPLLDVLDSDGRKGLEQLPHVGRSIGSAIAEMLRTGHLGRLDRLEGEVGAEDLVTSLPGIGPDLAHRIHDSLGVETLEDLEVAAHDGRLAGVQGFGPRRVRVVRDALSSLLTQQTRRRHASMNDALPFESIAAPTAATLLDVDAEYRTGAREGTLRRIAPRRFNPKHEAWLPILHTEGGGWSFTAMFSNTARAHALGMTHDWVVIFYERDEIEGRATVVTEHHGRLVGLRVVRGREAECARHYEIDPDRP